MQLKCENTFSFSCQMQICVHLRATPISYSNSDKNAKNESWRVNSIASCLSHPRCHTQEPLNGLSRG